MSVYYSPDLLALFDEEPKKQTLPEGEIKKPSPEQVDPWSLEPARNIRKQYIQHGGLGSREVVDGYYSHHDLKKYQCVHCKETFHWTPDLEYTDFGEVIDNLCQKCRKELRAMRTNHPEMI